MRQPRLRIIKIGLRLSHQPGDRRRRQGVLSHIAISRLVENVIGVTGAQQVEEIQPAFRCAGREPGEPVIADLRAKPVLAGMPRAGVIDGEIRRCLQPGAQNVLGFSHEIRLPISQQALQLALGNRHARRARECRSVDWP